MIQIYPNDGQERGVNTQRSADEVAQLYKLTHRWPPVVDGYLFKSREEVDAVIELRKRLKPIEHECRWNSLDIDDVRALLCFCRARKLNVDKACEMWLNAHEWRKVVRPDIHAPGFVVPDVLDMFNTSGVFGFDKEGSPIVIDRLGRMDPGGVLKHISVDEFLDANMVSAEYIQYLIDKCVVRDGKPHWASTVIFDLQGLGTQHLHRGGMAVLKRVLQQNDSYYPERAKRVFIVNAPGLFSMIWKIVQHFLDANTKEKVQIYPDVPLNQLLQYIDSDQIPGFLGGTAINGFGNPDCSPPIRMGGKVPSEWKPQEFYDCQSE